MFTPPFVFNTNWRFLMADDVIIEIPVECIRVPKAIRDAVVTATDANEGSVVKAITDARAAVKALPDYDSWIETLVDIAIQRLVYQQRGVMSERVREAMRASTGAAPIPPKTGGMKRVPPRPFVPASAETVREIGILTYGAYRMPLDGKLLKLLTPDELKRLIPKAKKNKPRGKK